MMLFFVFANRTYRRTILSGGVSCWAWDSGFLKNSHITSPSGNQGEKMDQKHMVEL